MAVDLTFARQQAEELLLIDRCTILRLPNARDLNFDEDTGRYEVSANNTVATDQPCSARERDVFERQSSQGGSPVNIKVFDVKFAADFDDVNIGDVIIFTTSSDPRLFNVPLNVQRVHAQTLRVLRRVTCHVEESRLGLHSG